MILKSQDLVSSISNGSSCQDYVKYIPNDETSLLEVKINYHFFRNDDGSGVFQPSDREKIDQITDWLNYIYRNLTAPTIAVIPPADTIYDSKISFKVTGIYYHDDSEYYLRPGGFWERVFYDKFGIDKGAVINVFYFLDPENKGYESTNTSTKDGLAAVQYIYLTNHQLLNWAGAQVLAHELGHCLGLNHTFQKPRPQFDDTYYPDSNRAWEDCNDYNISNNIMGYNKCRSYFSPKQLGFMHMRLLTNPVVMKFLLGSDNLTDPDICITGNITWDFGKFIDRNVVIEPNSTLTIKCTSRFSPNASIIVKRGGKLDS